MTVALAYLPKWEGIGPCVDEPHLMYPSTDHDLQRARSTCYACPVMDECRAWVTGLPYEADPGGVVAGLTLAERARLAGLIPPAKVCPGCEEELPYGAFALISRGRPRLKAYCKACDGRADRAPGQRRDEIDALPGEAHKFCPRCKITRGVSRFYPNPQTADSLSVWCKPCFESLRGSQ